MAELWLVCEGLAGSVDAAVLRPVLTTVLGADIVVEPSVGCSPAAVAQFIEAQRGGRAACILDRDYRTLATAEASFADGSPKFIWRRHCIENYLLPPTVIARAFRQLRDRFERQGRRQVPGWVAALPTDTNQVSDVLRDCARRRTSEETCRQAIQRLWEEIRESAGQVQKRVPNAPTSGDATDPAGWREALIREAERVRAAGNQTEADPHLDGIYAGAKFDAIYAEITTIDYTSRMGFLHDFDGKALLRLFHAWLLTRGAHRYSFENLRSDLASTIVDEYAANRAIHGTDDFFDLANGVRALAGLTPLA